MDINNQPIAVFDSGVGGLSVLKELLKELPNENYIYFGDSKNAPYGTKTVEEVRELTIHNVEYLMEMKAKAIVIACNTATSAAVDVLRRKMKDVPVIGIEPAIKPAAEQNKGGRVLVMATPMTLKLDKFSNLFSKYEDEAEIIAKPCPGLVEFVEHGDLNSEELEAYLRELLKEYIDDPVDAVVFGCTHYPFVRDTVQKILGSHVRLYDGGGGVARELKRQLMQRNLLNSQSRSGQLVILNSKEDPKEVRLCHLLLES